MTTLGLDETRLRRAFLEEAEDLSQKLGDTLLALEADEANPDLVNEVFRFTHSLKSESALMGYQSLSELAHRMEDVLGLARDGTPRPGESRSSTRSSPGRDLIAEMMAAIAKGSRDTDSTRPRAAATFPRSSRPCPGDGRAGRNRGPGPTPPRTAAARRLEARGDRAQRLREAPARGGADRGESLYKITVKVAETEPMKFPRAYLVFCNLELHANVVKIDPPMDGEPAEELYARRLLLTSAGEERLPPRRGVGGPDRQRRYRAPRLR